MQGTVSPLPPVKRRRSREETRRRLMESALSVFAKHGYERSTVDEIVREAGFSKGAFYVHFESKEDLFWELLQERIEIQQGRFRQALDPTLSAAENERRVLEVVFDANRNDPLGPAVYLEFVAHGMRNERVRERLGEMYSRWHAFVAESLRAGQEAGSIRTDYDVTLMASALLAMFEGGAMQSRLAPERVRLDAKLDEISEFLGDWLAPRKP